MAMLQLVMNVILFTADQKRVVRFYLMGKYTDYVLINDIRQICI